MEAHL
jgi:hypothetical protein